MSTRGNRKVHTLPGSDKWFGEEIADFGTEINDLMEDYAYEVRNQIEWINDYVSDVACSNKYVPMFFIVFRLRVANILFQNVPRYNQKP